MNIKEEFSKRYGGSTPKIMEGETWTTREMILFTKQCFKQFVEDFNNGDYDDGKIFFCEGCMKLKSHKKDNLDDCAECGLEI